MRWFWQKKELSPEDIELIEKMSDIEKKLVEAADTLQKSTFVLEIELKRAKKMSIGFDFGYTDE